MSEPEAVKMAMLRSDLIGDCLAHLKHLIETEREEKAAELNSTQNSYEEEKSRTTALEAEASKKRKHLKQMKSEYDAKIAKRNLEVTQVTSRMQDAEQTKYVLEKMLADESAELEKSRKMNAQMEKELQFYRKWFPVYMKTSKDLQDMKASVIGSIDRVVGCTFLEDRQCMSQMQELGLTIPNIAELISAEPEKQPVAHPSPAQMMPSSPPIT